MPSIQLSAEGRRLIKRLEKERKKKRFCEENHVDIRTLNELKRGQFKRAEVVSRIEQSLLHPVISESTAFRVVASYYGVTEMALRDPTRKRQTEEARMILALILHENCKLTKPRINAVMGYKHRTGAQKALEAITGATDPATSERIEEVRVKVRAAN